jgi:quercetin dioxygenase-like cupin family protein
MSLDAHWPDPFRRAASQADKVLKGAKPAKALWLTIPSSLLLRADRVIQEGLDPFVLNSIQAGRNMPPTPSAQILKVAELVDYQHGSVVSRVILKGETGSVTLFAFDEGQELSEHTAPFDALVHVLDGEAAIKISGKPFQLKTGEAIVMPANEPHAVKALKKFKMLLTMIRA